MPEATRARILAAARELFVTRGFRATTVRELGAAVGLTSAALYYHFPSKESCLVALVTPYLDAVEELLARHPVAANPGHEERRALLAGYLDVLVGDRELTRLIDRDPAVNAHPEIGRRNAALVDALVERLAGADGGPGDLLRATAALGAVRRPVLRAQIDVVSQADDLVEVALCSFEASG